MATEQEEKLRQEILDDARQKAADIIARAKANGDRLMADARKNGEERLNKRLAEASQRAEHQCGTSAQNVQQEARRYQLTQREAMLDDFFAKALTQAENAQGEKRLRSLATLAQEAMEAIGPQDMLVECRPADSDVVTQPWLQKIAGEIFGQAQINFELKTTPEARPGLVFRSKNGQRMFDNTYASRLEKLHDELRRQLAADK